MQAPGLDFTFL